MDTKIQKIKLMKIWEILNRKTDEDNRITTLQLIDELLNLGISCDRRTLYSDIDTMIEWDYEIKKQRYGRDMYYWVQKRKFDLPGDSYFQSSSLLARAALLTSMPCNKI